MNSFKLSNCVFFYINDNFEYFINDPVCQYKDFNYYIRGDLIKMSIKEHISKNLSSDYIVKFINDTSDITLDNLTDIIFNIMRGWKHWEMYHGIGDQYDLFDTWAYDDYIYKFVEVIMHTQDKNKESNKINGNGNGNCNTENKNKNKNNINVIIDDNKLNEELLLFTEYITYMNIFVNALYRNKEINISIYNNMKLILSQISIEDI